MFRLIDTIDGRARIITATAARAVQHHEAMSKAGLYPIAMNFSGKRLSLDELRARISLFPDVRPVFS